jgi:Serine hydrolase (FSH1)
VLWIAVQDFVDAPFAATGEAMAVVTDNFEPPYYQWWDAQEVQRDGKTEKYVYEGWTVSVDAIRERVSSSGPYDGVLGFSQV